jgi:hypothetical protein
VSVAPPGGQDRIMIYGPKNDGTYVVEFKTAAGEALAISIPRTETAVIDGRGRAAGNHPDGPRNGGR